jgi:hypothetical protein
VSEPTSEIASTVATAVVLSASATVFQEYTPVMIGAVFGGALRLCSTSFNTRSQSARVFLAAILTATIATSFLAKWLAMKVNGYTLEELKFMTGGVIAFAAHLLLPRLDREITHRRAPGDQP